MKTLRRYLWMEIATATVFVLLTITLAVYGQSGNFHLSG